MEQSKLDNLKLDAQNRAFGAKLNAQRKQLLRLCALIRQEFKEILGVDLPKYKADYKQLLEQVFMFEEYGDQLLVEFGDLANMVYTLEQHRYSVGEAYLSPVNLTIQTRTLAHTYSKHRLDVIYQHQKAAKIRKIYKQFIETEIQPNGLLYGKTPVHIVLTVPHPNGKFKGKDYYGDELIDLFNKTRKLDFWKDAVNGGFYCLEVSGSNKNGLHIHLHVAAWLNEGVSINDFRRDLVNVWRKKTGLKPDQHPMVGVETIYYYQKDNEGNYITTLKPIPAKARKGRYATMDEMVSYYGHADGSTPNGIPAVRKKHYVKVNQPKAKDNSPVDDYMQGVMECIKYTFKPSAIFDLKDFNFLLAAQVAKGSRGKRHYSRFGSFLKRPELSFNNLEPSGVVGADEEEFNGGKVANAMANAIHPVTLEPHDASLTPHYVVYRPEELMYMRRSNDLKKIIKRQNGQTLVPLNPAAPLGEKTLSQQNQSYETYTGQFTLVDNDIPKIIKCLVLNQKDKLKGESHAQFEAGFKIAFQLQAMIKNEGKVNEYVNYWKKNPDFLATYNQPNLSPLAQLNLVINAMGEYLKVRHGLDAHIALDDRRLPHLVINGVNTAQTQLTE